MMTIENTTATKIGIAIIGYGYWGPNLVRNFYQLSDCRVRYICERLPERAARAARDYPSITITDDYELILQDEQVQGVVIATPVKTHFFLARQALLHNKHIFVEKAFTSNLSEAEQLVQLARTQKKHILVDHIYLYHPAVRHIQHLLTTEIGTVQYIDSTRINLGLFQNDVDVVWDLGPHDISICNYLLDAIPERVSVIARSDAPDQPVSIAYISLHYPANRLAHIALSWISPVKIRQMLVAGDQKMIVFNDLETTEKVKVYDTSYKFIPPKKRHEILVDYRIGDIAIPKLDTREALYFAASDFITSIRDDQTPFSSGQTGLEVMRVLEQLRHLSSIK